jgi:hypothetical protein
MMTRRPTVLYCTPTECQDFNWWHVLSHTSKDYDYRAIIDYSESYNKNRVFLVRGADCMLSLNLL